MARPEPGALSGAPSAGTSEGPAQLIERASAAGLVLATAESLTAGAVVARLVDVPGASRCVAGGAACYSYEAKTRVLGVDPDVLVREGAVTESVARAMARGALRAYGADLAVSATGVAGPGPDERGVAAGTVFLAVARTGEPAGFERVQGLRLAGDRAAVREAAVGAAIALLADALRELSGPPGEVGTASAQ